MRAAELKPGTRSETVLRTVLIANRLRAVLPGRGPVAEVAYSPSGRYLLARDARAVQVFVARTRKLVRTLAWSTPPTAALFANDATVVVGRADGGVDAVSLDPGRSGRRLLPPGGGAVTSIEQARGGALLLVTKGSSGATLIAPGGRARALGAVAVPAVLGALDPSGRLAVLVAADAAGHVQARVYDVRSGRSLHLLPQLGVSDVRFAPAGTLLAVGSRDGTTTLWNPRAGRLLRTLDDDGGSVQAVAFSRDGSLLATGSSDGATRVWTVATGRASTSSPATRATSSLLPGAGTAGWSRTRAATAQAASGLSPASSRRARS